MTSYGERMRRPAPSPIPTAGSRDRRQRGASTQRWCPARKAPSDRHHLRHARRARTARRRPRRRRQDHPVPDPGRHPARHARRTRRARPRQDRLGQDPRVLASPWSPASAATLAGGKRRPGRPLGLVLAPTRELATQIDAVLAAARRRLRPEDHHDLRRRQPEAPGRRAARRRRHRRRLPRPPRGPHEAGLRDPRRRRDHRARRGRPHGRPRLPARRHPHHGQDAAGRPAPAVLGHARQRRGQARQAASCTTRCCTRSTRPPRTSPR